MVKCCYYTDDDEKKTSFRSEIKKKLIHGQINIQYTNAFFYFDLFMVYIPESKTHRYEILHTLNLGCSFITLREQCNNQRSRCDIACLHIKQI